jgi:hybrid polyketide synthase/nonribosomal peptide synthetase ACE1
MQEAVYSEDATKLFLRSYVNILREVVKPGGDKLKLGRLDKWDEGDVKKALALGKGQSPFSPDCAS